MKHSERAQLFRQVKVEYIDFLASVLWKLTGDRELFTEAMQYSLLGMWRHVEKLNGRKAGSYIYRIALTANSRAWRDRIGKNGQISKNHSAVTADPEEKVSNIEVAARVRQAVAQLPPKQAKAIVMRYFEQQDYRDVAEKLKCSEAGARSHVSKAIATLKIKLATLRN
ncbi:MAG: sigma-70 family RNA polymerase sigma factor [Phycisphaerae bacterium]|nr:sigma-70 family RNA polymerase sigma factor [Phycisphaerae bacterium]NIP52303.1 sigma-70 family RNA polymerase sigma factor [Phycisphaerae bacterium]NIS51266.1 sigma-70 family RNA polymerase sigma factor [Phycisphaerae bacterium]NIU09778.1 sigma-70 family RNA polymerase sigma factor [Phycisphaerae bacterium]NIU56566.1 sigma-70 family RNA polymerase sigma factor [Phycisphaerae bacterium]